ncbi:hypothetical protein BH09VER1_BH09VER1_26250 [soil metagenome]
MGQHFSSYDPANAGREHFFDQLKQDAEWAMDSAKTSYFRDKVDPQKAMAHAFGAIAGRRYSRFNEAEKSGDAERAGEMKAFALFWYGMETKTSSVAEYP